MITFAEQPSPAAGARAFDSGVRKIYAMWDYSGMQEGQVIRREWIRNGELWLEREEPWDFTKYGASGTITDIDIHDDANGLPDGLYELRLYIDGTWQFNGLNDVVGRSFSIGRDLTTSTGSGGLVMSPDGKLGALIDVGKLSIVDEVGSTRVLVLANIAGVSWMPDSVHLAYGAITSNEPLRRETELILINIQTGTKIILNRPSGTWNLVSPMHTPMVSPDGRYVAARITGYGDACASGSHLGFITLDPTTLEPIEEFGPVDFAGMPMVGDDYYPVGDLKWKSPTVFEASFRFTCIDGRDDGTFLLDLSSRSMEKIASIPPPEY